MAGRMRTDETSMLKRRIRADKRLREELSRNNAETREMIYETYQEIAEQLEIEGDWDEVYVQDQFNDDYEIRDVIEAFYDCTSVNKTLIEGGVSLYTVHRRENKKLEDVFIELTGGKEGGVQIG